jgi:serine/threonine protein kinase
MVFEPLGASLLTLIRAHRKGVPEHLVRQIATQVLAGLAFLHERCGIIHTVSIIKLSRRSSAHIDCDRILNPRTL